MLNLRFGAPPAARTQSAELDDHSDEVRAQEVAAQAARDGGEPEEELDGGETVIAIAKTVKKTGKLEQEKPRKRLRLAEAELGTALDVKLAEWVRHLESRPRDPVNATSPLLQFERGLGATKEDVVAQIFLDPKLAKGKRPGESELGGRLCAAISLTSSSSLLQRRAGPTVTFSVSSRSVIRRGICSGEKRKSFRGVPESAIRAPGTWVRLFSQCALPQREAQCSKFQVVVFLCAREEGLDGGGAASGCRYADSNTVVAQLMRLPTST